MAAARMEPPVVRTSEPDEASRPIPSTSSSASTRPNENNDEITAAPDNSTKSEKGAGREVDPQPPSSSPHDSEDSFLLVSPSASYPQTGGSTGSISSTSSICTGDAESGRGAAGGAAVAGTGTTARSHHFADATPTNTWLGQGSYGVVWRVQCIHCRREFAKKVIIIDPGLRLDERLKHVRNTESELVCYQNLRHPHVVDYVHHEKTDSKVLIYTEYCSLRDLQGLLSKVESAVGDSTLAAIIDEKFAWDILEALASALSRCHMGLNATKKNEAVLEYTGFEDEWKTILHRDIKPGNILLAVYEETGQKPKHIAKLGDFGTSYTLNDKAPSSQLAGTRDYWSTELAEEANGLEGRITKWSTQSDIWAVGAVIHRVLAKTTPRQGQEKSFEERHASVESKLDSAGKSVSKLLSHIVTHCIGPSPEGRPSALQLLSVAVKHDSSPEGRHRSESFWAAVSKHPRRDVASSVVKKFATDFLPLLAESRTIFSPKEVVSIMSLIKEYCPWAISSCHRQLCAGLKLVGGTVFHAMAYLAPEDMETATYALETSRWPQSIELSHLALKKNDNGLLPSAVAALRNNIDLCVQLAKFEDAQRSRTADIAQNKLFNEQKQAMERSASNEFEFMFQLLYSSGCTLSLRQSQAFAVLEKTARLGYTNIVRKLLNIGVIDGSTRGKRSETALHIFAYTGDRALVRLLKGSDCDVDAEDKDRRTPLHWAAWAGKCGTVEELLHLGAKVDAQDKIGRTPLYGAAGGGFRDVVDKLLLRGADKSLSGGKNHETPLDRARQKGYKDVISSLER